MADDIPQAVNPTAQKFKTFVESYPGGVQALARALGLTRQSVYNYISGSRFPTLVKAYTIERLTDGKILTTEWAKEAVNKKSVNKNLKDIL